MKVIIVAPSIDNDMKASILRPPVYHAAFSIKPDLAGRALEARKSSHLLRKADKGENGNLRFMQSAGLV